VKSNFKSTLLALIALLLLAAAWAQFSRKPNFTAEQTVELQKCFHSYRNSRLHREGLQDYTTGEGFAGLNLVVDRQHYTLVYWTCTGSFIVSKGWVEAKDHSLTLCDSEVPIRFEYQIDGRYLKPKSVPAALEILPRPLPPKPEKPL
jgi:hypothetical protein